MTKAIDPFEEYLRKKKVEMMEQKLREPAGDKAAPKKTEKPADVNPDEDPESSARLSEEMADFFESGQQAGAELFSQMQGLEEEKVEELKDALDEVFEEDAPVPQTAENENNFVEFFQRVETEFDAVPGGRPGPVKPVEAEPPPAEAPAPSLPAPKPQPVPPQPKAAVEGAEKTVEADIEDLRRTGDVDVSPLALTLSDDVSLASLREDGRLNLADILLSKENGADLDQQVQVLCRIVSRLAEKVQLPESEIIEALIRADVEF